MKHLLLPNQLLFKIIGEQSYTEKKYRFINFCITKKINEEFILYNNFTHEMILLSPEEHVSIFKTTPISALYTYLINHWFLVPEEFNEKDFVDNALNVYKTLIYNNSITKYTIMTTLDCNARCFYCYEKGREKTYMPSSTAYAVAKYIENNSKCQPVLLKWFGGEPLLNLQAISIICGYLNRNNVDFKSHIITNGYLFNQQLIKQFIDEWKLSYAQITLDGTKDLYNKVKSYIYNDKNPFEKVIGNIDELLNHGVRVDIRLNFASYNSEDLKKLLLVLKERFENNDLLNVYSSPLFEYKHTNQKNKQIVLADFLDFQKMQLSIFPNIRVDNTIRLSSCMADDNQSIVITPKGSLTKCEHFTDSEIVGNVFSNKIDNIAIDSWKEYVSTTDDCKNCILYPNCIHLKKCPNSFKCNNEYIKSRIQRLYASIEYIYYKNKI